jgi:hypothetical protein
MAAGRSHFWASLATNAGDETAAAAIPSVQIGHYSRYMRDSWIHAGEFDVSDEYVDYLQPLLASGTVESQGVTEFFSAPLMYRAKKLEG